MKKEIKKTMVSKDTETGVVTVTTASGESFSGNEEMWRALTRYISDLEFEAAVNLPDNKARQRLSEKSRRINSFVEKEYGKTAPKKSRKKKTAKSSAPLAYGLGDAVRNAMRS